MMQKNKDRLVGGLIGIGGSIISGLVLFHFTTKSVNSKEFQSLVNGKLDKSEYYNDQKDKWEQYDKEQAAQERTYTIQIEAVSKNMDKILEKVDWLYRNEINKKKSD